LKVMKRSDVVEKNTEVDENLSFAAKILAQSSKVTSKASLYIDPKVIPIGSVKVESLFSISKHIFGARRLGAHPTKVEEQLFLKTNMKFWNLDMVAEVVSQHGVVFPNVAVEEVVLK